MAYEPKEWVCSETITADALNNLEAGVQEALAKECGYSCREAEAELFNDTVTTTDSVITGIYTGVISPTKITADRIRVVYDGTPYTLDKDENGNYGTTDYDMTNFTIGFDDCPFLIFWSGNYNRERSQGQGRVEAIATETAGDHTLEIYAIETVATLTECFKIAVQSLTKPLIFTFEATEVTDPCEGLRYTYSHSWQEVHDAFFAGRPCIVRTVKPGVVIDQIVVEIFDSDAEPAIATRRNQFDFTDKNSKTHIECGTE